MKISRVGTVSCKVGEGPVWDAASETLLFVDLIGQTLHRHRPADGSFDCWPMPQHIAGVSLDRAGRTIVALADGFYVLDLKTGETSLLAAAHLPEGTQINDVKVDRDGRFVAGSMSQDMQSIQAKLLALDGSQVKSLADDFILINGPCWNPEGDVFYCSDTIRAVICAFDYDRTDGSLSNRRHFADTAVEGGMPDGATVDAEGNMWVAMLGSGNIVVYSPDGSVIRRVAMPTAFVSSVAFGGTDLDRLYVTSLDPSVAGREADEGATFLYMVEELGVRGLADARVGIGGVSG